MAIMQMLLGAGAGISPGAAMEGGFFAGYVSYAGNGVASHILIVSPRSTGDVIRQFKTGTTANSGTFSLIDGLANSNLLNSAAHPAAKFCLDLVTGGYSDWYLPAIYELDIIYKTLKPGTTSNSTASNQDYSYGINAYSVPPQTVANTASIPAQVANPDFQSPSGAERLTDVTDFNYWSSNPGDTSSLACFFNMRTGVGQLPSAASGPPKTDSLSVRAVRRVAL